MMSENPWEIGPAGEPIDPSEFDKARLAWYADRDRIVADVLPAADRAITKVNDWSQTVSDLAGLVGQVLPLVQTLVSSASSTSEAKSANSGLLGFLQDCQSAKGELQNLAASWPAVSTALQTALKKV
jgi:hypothetical protein